MRILLDTHIFLWYLCGDDRISQQWINLIQAHENEVFLSVVSLWEAMVKYQIGKLALPEPPEIYLPR